MTISPISATDCIALRHSVLRPHQTEADCIYPGDDIDSSYHFGAFLGDELVCIASVFKQEETRFERFTGSRQYRLRGMATHPDHRGQGLGKAVLAACLDKCWSVGGHIFWCNARTTASGYYEKMGFEAIDEEFDIEGIGPHLVMYRRRP